MPTSQRLLLLLILVSISATHGQEEPPTQSLQPTSAPSPMGAPAPKQQPPLTTTGIANTGYRWTGFTVVATVVAAGVVAAGVFGVFSMFFPLLAYKVCYLVGGCQDTLEHYVDEYVASSSTESYPRSRRSLEYLGPLLETLAAAYERYGADTSASYAQVKKTPTPWMSQPHYAG